jgi:hypothetical protein
VAEVRFVLADEPEVEFVLGERSVNGTRNLRLAELDTAGRAEAQQLLATAREARARPGSIVQVRTPSEVRVDGLLIRRLAWPHTGLPRNWVA